MDIYESMKQAGATDAQLASKTMKMVEEILAKDPNVIPDTVRANIGRLAQSLDAASQRYAHAEASVQAVLDRTEAKMDWLNNETKKAASAYEKAINAKDSTILDKDMLEAVKAYRAVLVATKEVFGDTIDSKGLQDCIVAAINAGSYVAWRGIMGPKNNEGSKARYL